MEIGEKVGTGNSKTVTAASNDGDALLAQTFDSATLNKVAITTISRGDALNARERGIVNSRGFKLDFIVGNLSPRSQAFHYAIVSPKDSDTVSETEFFRAYNSDRARDFVDIGTSGIDGMVNPINADKFTIFKHGKLMLKYTGTRPTGNGIASDSQSGQKKVSLWIPTARQLRYSDVDSSCQTPMWLLWWSFNPMKLATDALEADALRFQYRVVHHFKEPKN